MVPTYCWTPEFFVARSFSMVRDNLDSKVACLAPSHIGRYQHILLSKSKSYIFSQVPADPISGR